jgi:hypothetical protein
MSRILELRERITVECAIEQAWSLARSAECDRARLEALLVLERFGMTFDFYKTQREGEEQRW